jgi:hypothetical protein
MVEGDVSYPPSRADSPPRVEMLSPGEELEEGLKEVPKINFPDDNESGIKPEDPYKF